MLPASEKNYSSKDEPLTCVFVINKPQKPKAKQWITYDVFTY